MSRIIDMALEPQTVYEGNKFVVKVKVQDDYKYKKYLITEDIKYKVIIGSDLTITDADESRKASVIEIKGAGKGNLIAKDNWELGSISGNGSTMGQNTPATNRIRNIEYIAVEPNTTYTLTLLGDTSTVAFVFEYNSEKVGTKRIPSTWTATPFTFTTQDTTYFVRVIFSTTDVTLGQNVELRKEGDSVVTGDNNIVVSNKNLFDKENATILGLNGKTGVGVEDTFTSATNQKHIYISCKPNTIYTVTKGTTINSVLGIYETSNKPSVGIAYKVLYFSSSNNGTATITTGTNAKYLDIRITTNATSETDIQTILNSIQIEEGNQATDYIAHQGNSYRVDLGGKNLFNDILRQGVTIYNTGVWGNTNTRITSTDWIKNVKAGTYTISAKTSTTKTLQVSMVTFNTSGIFNNVSGVSGQWKTMPFTFTIPIDMNLKCNIKYSNETAITPIEVTEVQLESGTQATQYSPYTDNPIELTEQDKIWNDGGVWKLNNTEITDDYLLNQLQNINNIDVYENLMYVDWIGEVKAIIDFQYPSTEKLKDYIITEDGKKIRTDWRNIGRREKWTTK